MSFCEGERVNMLTRYQDLSDRPININDRLLHFVSRSIGTQRNDEGGESLRTTFGLASPLLRPYITDSSRIQHRFNTSESRIVDEKVIKRCSEGDETPKLVRSRYGSDQEAIDLSSFVPTDYLPYNYDVGRRVQENRKTVTKREPKKPRGEYEENQQRLIREGVRYDF